MSETEKVKSEVLYKKVVESMDKRTEITLSTESATDDGAWGLFTKLKKEMKVDE